MAERSTQQRKARVLVQQLESLQRAGVTHLPKATRKSASAAGSGIAKRAEDSAAGPVLSAVSSTTNQQPAAEPGSVRLPAAQVLDALAILRQDVCECERCELATTRTQTVFGVGNPRATICFLGEAPGADEDAQGEPFVGRAGQLLTKIIEACKLRREDVYILNVLKCRPPGNRNPLPNEVASCRGFLERQLELIKPEYIVCLGTVAAQSLLQTDQSIGKLRGKFFEHKGATVICTYHPAYLLRNPAAKRDVWEDMKLVMRKVGVEL